MSKSEPPGHAPIPFHTHVLHNPPIHKTRRVLGAEAGGSTPVRQLKSSGRLLVGSLIVFATLVLAGPSSYASSGFFKQFVVIDSGSGCNFICVDGSCTVAFPGSVLGSFTQNATLKLCG